MRLDHFRRIRRHLVLCISLAMGLAAMAGNAMAQRIYVSNPDSNQLSVYDLSDPLGGTLVAQIAVGTNPQGVALSPDKTRTYVANAGSNTVSVIDNSSLRVVGTIPVGGAPYDVVASPDGNHLYVANSADSTVSQVDLSTYTIPNSFVVGARPVAIAISPSGSHVVTANYDGHSVSIIDPIGFAFDTVPGIMNAYDVTVSPDGQYLYALDSSNGDAIKRHIVSGTQTSVSTGTNPHSFALSADGSRLFVANYSSNHVTDIATSTMTANPIISTTHSAHNIAISSDDSRIYTTTYGANVVAVSDTATRSQLMWFTGYHQTSGIAYGPAVAPPAAIPTLGEWAMILLTVMLAGGAAVTLQRRRRLA